MEANQRNRPKLGIGASPEEVEQVTSVCLHKRLRQWKQVRSWARLIRAAENLWHVDEKELKRLGAIELMQLHHEVPLLQRKRVKRWLDNYSLGNKSNQLR